MFFFVIPGLLAQAQYNYEQLESWYDAPSDPDSVRDWELADVFFIHPTTYYRMRPRNQLRVSQTELRRAELVRMSQASAFEACGRIFMPKYRQVNLNTMLKGDTTLMRPAMDTAYADVRNAFRHYLKVYHRGRPIVIASHSQGSFHALRLLKEFFSDSLRDKLVCAYVVGIPIGKEHLADMPGIPLSSKADQTACLVTWMSLDEKSGVQEPRPRAWSRVGDRYIASAKLDLIAVNPISWTTDPEIHTGKPEQALLPVARSSQMRYANHSIRARIDKGFVRVNGHNRSIFNGVNGNLHVFDYHLFYRNIRENACLRTSVYLDSH
jgi:hypothetical protein